MSQTLSVENITVLQVGKYGVRVDEKTWYGVNDPLTPSHFAPGQSYKVAISVSKTGKKYIKEVVGVTEASPSSPAPAAPKVDTERAERITSAIQQTSAPKAEKPKLDIKTIQIQRQGLYQAALQSPALTTWAISVDEYLAIVRKVADAGVAYVNEG
jgi:hypothetical protein